MNTSPSEPPTDRPRAFHILAKPAGPVCNLDCGYCFYLHKTDALYPDVRAADMHMSDEVLEAFVRDYIAAQEVPQVNFAWQGGEPTLLGVDFFRRAVEYQQRHCQPGTRITNALQTNGILLDDEWGAFLKEHNFLVGLSLDGPAELHDRWRVDRRGQPSFEQVMRGREFLLKHQVEHNALCVVNRDNGSRPREVYGFFRDQGFEHIQFIPCVERLAFEHEHPGTAARADAAPHTLVTDWSVRPEQYGAFLVAVFEEWVRNDVGRIFVQLFEECAAAWSGIGASLCIFQPTCGRGLAIEHNGDLFSCDHYVYPEYHLGNILDTPLAELASTPFQEQFGRDKADALPAQCRSCDVLFMCNGGCPRNRFLHDANGEPGLNYLCGGYYHFFTHVDPYMRAIVRELRSGRPAAGVMHAVRAADGLGQTGHTASQKAPGRNAPCPCGSGRKFKRCCGRAPAKTPD